MVYNLTLAIGTILFSLFFLFFAFQLPAPSGATYTLGPGHWPIIILTIMLIMGIVHLLITLKNKNSENKESIKQENNFINKEISNTSEQESFLTKYKQWIILLSLVLYTYSMVYIGFFLSSILFLFAATLIMGLKSKVKSLVIAIIGATTLVLLFGTLLNIPLPRGVEIFRELSYIIY